MDNKKFSMASFVFAIGMVAALVLVGTAMGEVSRTELVAEYHFDGDAKDSSGNGNDGVVHGGTFVQGISGQALSFDGVDDKVTFNNTLSTITTITDSFTMELWVNPSSTHEIDPEANNGFGGTSGQKYAIWPTWFADRDNSGAGISIGTNGVSVYEHADNYMPAILVWNSPLSGWTQIVVVYNNKQPSLYVNGNFVKNGLTSTRIVHPSIELLGSTTYGNFNGIIDEVRIYNRSLGTNEIKANFEASNGSKELILELINSVSSRIDILKRNNLDTSIIDQALKNAKDANDLGKYDEAYSLAQNAQKMADDAYQSYQLIDSSQSEIEGAISINADVSKADNKLKEAKDALAKGDYQRAQSWANEAMQLAKHASIGTVSIKDLKALAPKYDERSVVISGNIRSIETVYGKGYKFAMDDGSGMISVVYQGSLGDIKDGEKIKASGIFQASNGTVVADNVQKSGITSAPAFEVILAGIGILMAFVLRRR